MSGVVAVPDRQFSLVVAEDAAGLHFWLDHHGLERSRLGRQSVPSGDRRLERVELAIGEDREAENGEILRRLTPVGIRAVTRFWRKAAIQAN